MKKVSKEKLKKLFNEVTKDKDLKEVVTSSIRYPEQGKPCKHGRRYGYTLGCMQHNFEHVVGYYCMKCQVQWFFEPDWRTKECRDAPVV